MHGSGGRGACLHVCMRAHGCVCVCVCVCVCACAQSVFCKISKERYVHMLVESSEYMGEASCQAHYLRSPSDVFELDITVNTDMWASHLRLRPPISS